MKEGTRVKVLENITGHNFNIGEIVMRRPLPMENAEVLGFRSKENGDWYMAGDEYEIIPDHQYAIDLMTDAMNAARAAGFSRNVWEGIAAVIEAAEQEMEDSEG